MPGRSRDQPQQIPSRRHRRGPKCKPSRRPSQTMPSPDSLGSHGSSREGSMRDPEEHARKEPPSTGNPVRPRRHGNSSTHPDAEIIVSAAVGVVGLPATYKAIEAGKHIALANKEVLVAAGEVIMAA